MQLAIVEMQLSGCKNVIKWSNNAISGGNEIK